MKFGNFEITVIRESRFRLDGGAMFGVVPKVVWEPTIETDQKNRVQLNCNLLLIETDKSKILLETGMGNRWSDKERNRYEIETLVEPERMLSGLNIDNKEIDAVVLSHLHFDHAGGATVFDGDKLVPTFPNAKYYIQRGEWDFAHKANDRARGSYRKDDFLPLQESGVVELCEGDSEISPGIWLKVTGGHTKHHQIVYFESGDSKGVYFADILPTKSHVQPPWVMGYDHYPLESCDIKSEWLSKASSEGWLVVFDHEPGIPWGKVIVNQKNKFEFVSLPEESLQYGSKISMNSFSLS